MCVCVVNSAANCASYGFEFQVETAESSKNEDKNKHNNFPSALPFVFVFHVAGIGSAGSGRVHLKKGRYNEKLARVFEGFSFCLDKKFEPENSECDERQLQFGVPHAAGANDTRTHTQAHTDATRALNQLNKLRELRRKSPLNEADLKQQQRQQQRQQLPSPSLASLQLHEKT